MKNSVQDKQRTEVCSTSFEPPKNGPRRNAIEMDKQKMMVYEKYMYSVPLKLVILRFGGPSRILAA